MLVDLPNIDLFSYGICSTISDEVTVVPTGCYNGTVHVALRRNISEQQFVNYL